MNTTKLTKAVMILSILLTIFASCKKEKPITVSVVPNPDIPATIAAAPALEVNIDPITGLASGEEVVYGAYIMSYTDGNGNHENITYEVIIPAQNITITSDKTDINVNDVNVVISPAQVKSTATKSYDVTMEQEVTVITATYMGEDYVFSPSVPAASIMVGGVKTYLPNLKLEILETIKTVSNIPSFVIDGWIYRQSKIEVLLKAKLGETLFDLPCHIILQRKDRKVIPGQSLISSVFILSVAEVTERAGHPYFFTYLKTYDSHVDPSFNNENWYSLQIPSRDSDRSDIAPYNVGNIPHDELKFIEAIVLSSDSKKIDPDKVVEFMTLYEITHKVKIIMGNDDYKSSFEIEVHNQFAKFDNNLGDKYDLPYVPLRLDEIKMSIEVTLLPALTHDAIDAIIEIPKGDYIHTVEYSSPVRFED